MSPVIDLTRAGAPEAAWSEFLARLHLPELDLEDVGAVVVVAPHPDDEVLGCGGLLAALAQSGRPVTVLAATDGEAAVPGASARARALLAATRRSEERQALDELDARIDLRRLGLGDGKLAAFESELAEAIAAQVGPGYGSGPSDGRRTLCLAPYRDEGHPDHEAAGRAAATACARTGARLVEYFVWTWHWAAPSAASDAHNEVHEDDVAPGEDPLGGEAPTSGPPWTTTSVFRLTPDQRAAKARAISAFVSQTSAGPSGAPVLPDAFLQRFTRPVEVFLG